VFVKRESLVDDPSFQFFKIADWIYVKALFRNGRCAVNESKVNHFLEKAISGNPAGDAPEAADIFGPLSMFQTLFLR
jgi:hypothetical protein